MQVADHVIVKVTLKTTADPNESSVKKEWASLLATWAAANGCEIDQIVWTRYRQEMVDEVSEVTGKVSKAIKCYVVEEGR